MPVQKLAIRIQLWKIINAMKTYFAVVAIIAGAFLSGCTTDKNEPVLDTVGPSPDQPLAANSTSGTLVVYSAYEVNADFAARDHRSPIYSDYNILAADGKLLKKVHNNSGTILQCPVAVELSPGKYHVVAHANGYAGYLAVPVVIASLQTTILHLEGDGFWPDKAAFNQTNAVRLPDGRIIGWKAVPDL
jgi:hypothetical protein